ncbi:O-antigen ligase-related [actinobacterium SCGC AAA044-D11]
MDMFKNETLIGRIFLILIPLITLAVSPYKSYDPINVPKFSLLVVGSTVLGVLLFANKFSDSFKLPRILAILLILFVLQLFIVLLTSKAPINQQIFGTFGRNTGLITYLSFVVVLIVAFNVSNPSFALTITYSISITSMLFAGYCTLQTFNLDPISWVNPYNPITGSLGNPNFASSFLAMSSCALLVLGIKHIKKIKIFFTIIVVIIIYLFLIYRSESIQGFLVFAIGSMAICTIYIYHSGALRKFLLPTLVLEAISSLVIIMGILNKGPFSFLHKESIRQRGYYWDSAVEMMKLRPLSGVGLDSFGDWYYQVRSVDSAIQSPLITSSAAHNVFLDMGSNGGFPLFMIYISLMIFTLISGIRYLKKLDNFDYGFTSIFAIWICYQAQSLISINQIGIAIWGWALTGLVIGYLKSNEKQKNGPNKSKNKNLKMKTIPAFCGFILGLVIGLPPLLTDANFRSAYVGQSAEKLISASLKYPQDTTRILNSAEALAKSNLMEQSDSLITHILEVNPRLYGAWQLRYQISQPDSNGQKYAKKMLNELNPQVKIK